jgi:hypothetical protein
MRILEMPTASIQERDAMDWAKLERTLGDVVAEIDAIRERMKDEDERAAVLKSETAVLKAETRALLSEMNLGAACDD